MTCFLIEDSFFGQVSDKLFDEINWLTVHSLKAVSVSCDLVHCLSHIYKLICNISL